MEFRANTHNYRRLIKKAKSGNSKAFRELFEKTHRKLFAYTAARITEKEDAKDIVQDCFVDLWRALPDFDYRTDQSFLAFVFVILKRKLAHYYQENGHDMAEFDENTLTTATVDKPSDEYGVVPLISKLRPEYAEVLRLRYWSNLKFREIAEIMKEKPSTIKTWHRRAIHEMDNLLKNHENT